MKQKGKRRISEALYRKLYAEMPIFCADVVAEDAQGRFIVVRRKNEPARGKWWLPGGRVLKDERVAHAAVRKLKEETGIKGKFECVIGFFEFFSRKGFFKGVSAHTPVAVCLVRVARVPHVLLDSQSGGFRRVKNPVADIHPDLAKIIRERHRRKTI